MSAERIPEADEEFRKAIEKYQEAYGHKQGLLMEWVLITSEHVDNGDGTTSTGYATKIEAQQPLHRSVGLIQYAKVKFDYLVANMMRD